MLRNLNRSSGGRRILGVPHVGILAAAIASQTATGDNGPGLLYDESISPSNAGKLLRLVVTAHPVAGVFFPYENGSFDFSGAPNGTYSVSYNWLADNVLAGSDSATINVGVIDATAPGATLTGAGTISAGAASGSTVVNATAPGAPLTGVGSITTNSASGEQNATAPGATLTGTSSITAGTASGGTNGDAAAPGTVLTGDGSIAAGAATGNQNAIAPGASLTGDGAVITNSATGNIDAIAPGATLSGTGTIVAGGANIQAPQDVEITHRLTRHTTIRAGVTPPMSHPIGDTVRLNIDISDENGALIDPAAITVLIKAPKTAVASNVPSKTTIGVYFLDIALDKVGTWYYRIETPSPRQAIAEGSLTVAPSRFVQS